jgi:ribose-phosphate pyrophosphokinase
MKILTGTAHEQLATEIAEKIGLPLTGTNVTRFPDGETFVKIMENIRGEDIFIIQPICGAPNEAIMELLIIIDAARRASANRITAVIPYYGYSRQDRKDQPRVPITAKLVANLLVAAGTNRILTMDLHAQQIQGFFDIPVDHLYAAPVIVNYLKQTHHDDLVVVSPDPGGLKMAYAYASMLNAGLAIVGKHRKTATEVEAFNLVGDVKGCNALLVDDMTTTAGTLCAAAELVKAAGGVEIRAAVTHLLLNEQGMKRILESDITELIATNSVPPPKYGGIPVTTLSIASLLANAIERIHNNQSVSSLFNVE